MKKSRTVMTSTALLLLLSETVTSLSLPDLMPDAMTRSEALRSLALPLGVATAFRGGAAVAVIGQPRMPPPDTTAPFQTVGCRTTRVRTGEADGGSCRVKIFYPAAASAAAANNDNDAAYCSDGIETSNGMAGLVGFRQLGLAFLLAHLADARSGCKVTPIHLYRTPEIDLS